MPAISDQRLEIPAIAPDRGVNSRIAKIKVRSAITPLEETEKAKTVEIKKTRDS
jgi:hypothetical protein